MAWDCGEQQRGGPANRSTSFTDPTVHVSETTASRALCLYTFLKRRRPVRCVHQDPEPVRLKCVGHVVSGHPLILVDRVRLAAITSRTSTKGSGYFPTVETRVRRHAVGTN